MLVRESEFGARHVQKVSHLGVQCRTVEEMLRNVRRFPDMNAFFFVTSLGFGVVNRVFLSAL